MFNSTTFSTVGRERRLVVPRQQVGRVAVDRDAAGGAEVGLGEAAAEHADRLQARLARRLGVLGRVADDDRLVGGDVRRACASAAWKMSGWGFDFSASSDEVRLLDQVVDPGDLLVVLQLVLLGRRGQDDPACRRP